MKKQTPNRIILINALSAGLLNGISMLMLPVYSYLLGTDNYGLASIYTTWSNVLGIIIGLQAASSIGVARKDFTEKEQLPFQANGVYIGSAMAVIMTVVFCLFSKPIANWLRLPQWSIWLLCPHAFGIFCIGMLNSKFTYEFKQDKNLVLSVSMSLGTALISVIAILLMPKEERYFGKVVGTAVPQIICGVILLIYLFIKVGLCIQEKYLKYIVHYSLPLVFSNLCLNLFASSDKLMIQWMNSNSEVGIYSLAFGFASVISSIWYALNHAWSPLYYKYEADGDEKELLYHTKNYTFLFSCLVIGFILLSPEVFRFLAASEFLPGTKLIPIFVAGFYLNFIGCFARNFQYYYKDTKTISIISITTAGINIGMNAFLIPQYGAMGAAFATMLTQFLGFLGNWLTAKYRKNGIKEFPYGIKLVVPYICLIVLSMVLFYVPKTVLIRWVLAAVMGSKLAVHLIKTKQIF